MADSALNIWDPLSNNIDSNTFLNQQKDLLNTLNFYRKNPYVFKIIFVICCLIPVIAVIIFIRTPYDLRFLLICLVPPIVYYGYVKRLQEQIILYLLCEKNNWQYNPADDSQSTQEFAKSFPEVFDKGHDQTFDEQVWGMIKSANGEDSFWSGKFEYVTGSGRSQTTHTEYVFIFKLSRPLSVEFSLDRAGIFKAFEEHIKTESEDFNNTFRIVYNDLKDQTEIIKILSPSVQTRMIDFSKKYHTNQITFVANLMIIVLSQDIWKTKYTNFLKNVSIDERDEDNYFQSLRDMAELPTEMIQFIK